MRLFFFWASHLRGFVVSGGQQMRTLLHIMLGCLAALGASQLPLLISFVAIVQATVAKAQYDLYHADADTTLHLSDIVLMLLAGFAALIITRVML